jgi:protein XRP2
MVDQCKDSTIIVGPVAGSIFVRDCENCTVYVACQQFRCRDLKNCTIYLYAMNDPVIEASSGLTFAPFNLGYPKLREQARTANLDISINRWELVFDFSRKSEDNHKMLEPSEFKTELK